MKMENEDIGIFYHEECSKHHIPNHIERPQRVQSILNSLNQKFPRNIFYRSNLIQEDLILLFHEEELLETFKDLCNKSEKLNKIVRIDGDTEVCKDTRNATYRSAGSIIDAIDRIYKPIDDPLHLRLIL